MLQFVVSDEGTSNYQMVLYISDWSHDLEVEAAEQDTQVYVELQKISWLRASNLPTYQV